MQSPQTAPYYALGMMRSSWCSKCPQCDVCARANHHEELAYLESVCRDLNWQIWQKQEVSHFSQQAHQGWVEIYPEDSALWVLGHQWLLQLLIRDS